jgi:hypothetical protein
MRAAKAKAAVLHPKAKDAEVVTKEKAPDLEHEHRGDPNPQDQVRIPTRQSER